MAVGGEAVSHGAATAAGDGLTTVGMTDDSTATVMVAANADADGLDSWWVDCAQHASAADCVICVGGAPWSC